MPTVDLAKMEELRKVWIDRFVQARIERPELKRFEGKVGKVITVNYGGKAIVDFCDGAWYDIPASEDYLIVVTDDELKKKYDPTVNSAQAFPTRQS